VPKRRGNTQKGAKVNQVGHIQRIPKRKARLDQKGPTRIEWFSECKVKEEVIPSRREALLL